MATGIVATGGQPFTAPHLNTNKDFGTVVWEFLATKQKDFIKVFGYATGWTSIALGSENPTGALAGRVSGFMGDAKNLLSAMEIPDKAAKLRHAFERFIAEPSFDTARDLFLKELTGIINPICDAIDLSSKFVPITELMPAVKGVNFTATLIGAGNNCVQQVQEISERKELDADQTTLNLLNIARDTSYVALGIIGLSSLFLGFAAAPWMFLACLTSGLTFTIGGFFYERVVVNPSGKHDNFSLVRENLNAEIDHLRNATATGG
jgi:hypothetical protein